MSENAIYFLAALFIIGSAPTDWKVRLGIGIIFLILSFVTINLNPLV